MTSVLVLHHCEFSSHIDSLFAKGPGTMRRVDMEAFEVEVDVPTDDRDVWFFKGLSVPVVNHLLRVVSCQSQTPFEKELSIELIRQHTVPYDDMTFDVNGENLQVVYSIKDIELSKFRQSIIGPQGIALYEREIPHFGPILVYKAARTETETNEDLIVSRKMLPIHSDVAAIREALKALNFGA